MLKALKNKEIKNAGWIIGERVLQTLLSLVIGALSARYLKPDKYGALNYTASFVTFFSSIALLGMEGVIIKKMISEPKKEGELLGGCIILRFFSSLICSLAIVFTVFILNPNDNLKVILALLQSIQLIFQSVSIFDSWFQRYLKSKYISIGKIVAFLVMSAYKIFLLATSKSIEWFAFSNSLSYLVIGILLIIFYKRNKGQKVVPNVKAGFSVLKDSYHYILSGLMIAIYGQMDKIMIGKMLSDTDVGLYTTALNICSMWVFVPLAIINSFRPSLMELHQAKKIDSFNLRLRQLYSVIMWLCIVVSVIVCFLAPIAVNIIYGKDYMGAVGSLQIAIWCETFSMIGTARGIWLICENKSHYLKYCLGIGAVTNLVLNALLIPKIGIEGAAVATLVTQIVSSVISPIFFKATREHTSIVWDAFCFKWYFDKKRKKTQTAHKE